MRARRRPTKGFTLIELMVASAIAFIIVAAAAALASAMARNVKRVEEQSDLGVKAALAHAFLADVLSGAGYAWSVSQLNGSTNTGAFGTGACASQTNFCTAGAVYPMQVCRGNAAVSLSSCTAPDTTASDAFVTYVPRDTLIEAVTILDAASSTTDDDDDDAGWSGNCNAPGNNFVVKGEHQAWSAGDIVLVTRFGHVSIAHVRAALAASDGTANQVLQLDLPNLNDDDGGRSGCSVETSLEGARVMRIKGVVLKVESGLLKLTQRITASTEQTSILVSDVDDLGFRWQIAKVGADASTTSLCALDAQHPWASANLGGACGAVSLQAGAAAQHVRVAGLNVTLKVSASVGTQAVALPVRGVFDRAATTLYTDRKLHREVVLFTGLSNASAF